MVAQSLGFATAVFAWIVASISGGHRYGTHSLIGIAVFTAGADAAGKYQAAALASGGHPGWCLNLVPIGPHLTLLCSAAFRSLKIGSHHGDLLGAAAVRHDPVRRGPARVHQLARPAAGPGHRCAARAAAGR